MKLSPWYKTEKIKPIRKGWYECKCCSNDWWWDGKTWCVAKNKFQMPPDEVEYWRGILK